MTLDERRVDVALLLEGLGLPYRRDGGRLYAPCPEHQTDGGEPVSAWRSWSIRDDRGSDDNGIHYCFSCSFGGRMISVVERVIGIGDVVAREWIEEKAIGARGVELSARVRIRAPSRAFRLPAGVEAKPLRDWIPSAAAYARSRGIGDREVDAWGIGYAIAGRLRGRIVIPVRDYREELVNYTARTFTGQDRKYLAASEGEGADLDAIFGEARWPRARRDLVVVEGALNALAVARVDERPVAALLGSDLRPGHAAKLGTFRRLLVLTDPDAAGEKASRALAALRRHVEVVRLELPEGEDAASLDPEDLRKVLA